MAAPTAGKPAPGVRSTFVSYARLVKFQFVLDFCLALVVAWTALPPEAKFSGQTYLVLLTFVLGQIGVLSAVMSLDDVTGIKDGSDQANYLHGDQSRLRPLSRKPLLTGALSVSHAARFGYLSIAWGVLWWTVTALIAPHPAPWAILVAALLLTSSVQYSWGLKLSYRGLGEALLLLCPAAFVVAPYGFLTGELPALVAVCALLFGFGQLMIGAYSNTNDIEGDAAVGRRTVAVLTSPRGNRVFLGCVTTANLALIVLPPAVGWVPWWFPLVLLPVVVLRVRQYGSFLSNGNPLLARKRGVVVFRTTVVCLLAAGLLHSGF
ncbi:UbiA family prenyltransferase [Nonomuraea longicatena]|uniref:1,4-dihydroxy-2-naphthoate prenyltransferase n=1 Tax=Nonomuraea longicatena TaxID=83682 RepID=A0ABN1PXE9_9ACTN